MKCQYARSDMTPCYTKDGVIALCTDSFLKHLCVGCERRIYPTNGELSDYDKLVKQAEATKRRKRRR